MYILYLYCLQYSNMLSAVQLIKLSLRHSHKVKCIQFYPRNPFLNPFGTICCWLLVPVRQGFILFLWPNSCWFLAIVFASLYE